MLKRILIVLGVLVLLVVAAVVAIPFLVPKEEVKRLLATQVERTTGRTLTLAGELDVQVLPVLAVTAGNVGISNPPGIAGNLADVGELVIELDWMSLLSRKLVINRLVLDRPQVALLVDAQGHGNWDFAPPAPDVPPGPTATPAEADRPPADGIGLEELQFTGVEIRNGRVSYADAAGASHVLDNLDLTLDLPGLQQPLDIAGKGRLDGTDMAFAAWIGQLRALAEGGTVPARLSLSANAVDLRLEGQLDAGAAQSFDGSIDLAVPSLPALLALAGQDEAAVPPALDRLNLKAGLQLVPEKITLEDLALDLGALSLAGRLVVEPAAERPRIAGTLSTGVLDLGLLMPPEGAATAAPGAAAPAAAAPAAPAPAGREAWPDTPIDVSALSMVDLDLALSAEGLRYDRFQAGAMELKLALSDRNLVADLTRMALYGGGATSQVNVNARGGAPQFAVNTTLTGIQAEPILATLADFDRLTGQGDARAALTSSGATVRQAVANLAGQGAILFRDGSIKGINIGQALRAIGSGFREPFTGPLQATDFSELSASYTISGGVLHNSDLSLKSPLLQVGGAGTVSIIDRSVDYRATPALVPTAVGQGREDRLHSLAVPLLIRGPLEDPQIVPDIQGVTLNLLQNPEAAVEQLRGLRENLPGQLGDMLRGGAAGPAGQAPSPAEDPRGAVEDAVRGILGGQSSDPAGAVRGLFNR